MTDSGEIEPATGERDEPRPAPLAELAFVGVLLAITVSLFVQAVALDFFAADGTIGAGFFPISLGVLLLIGIVAYAVMVVRWGVRGGWRGDPGERLVSSAQGLLLGIVVLGIALGEWIGILGVVAIIMFGGLLFVDRARPFRAVLVAIGTLIAVVLIFDVGLGLDLGVDLPF